MHFTPVFLILPHTAHTTLTLKLIPKLQASEPSTLLLDKCLLKTNSESLPLYVHPQQVTFNLLLWGEGVQGGVPGRQVAETNGAFKPTEEGDNHTIGENL